MQEDKYYRALHKADHEVEVTAENNQEVREAAADWLLKLGNCIEHDSGKYVESVNMAGGCYLLFDENNEVAGLTNDLEVVYAHLEM